jgi:hypothetical protein
VLVLHLEAEDVERLLERDGLLVGAIAGGERVEDVGDAHHLRLERDLFGAQAVRVARAVEALVVRAGDDRDAAELLAPGDLREELERVRDVAADLVDLARVSEPRATERRRDLDGGEQRVGVAVAST